MAISIESDEEFNAKFEEMKNKPMILYFTATWSFPCIVIKPFVQETAPKNVGRMSILQINVDECKESCQKYDANSVPTFILIVNGEKMDSFIGPDQGKLEKMIEQALG